MDLPAAAPMAFPAEAAADAALEAAFAALTAFETAALARLMCFMEIPLAFFVPFRRWLLRVLWLVILYII